MNKKNQKYIYLTLYYSKKNKNIPIIKREQKNHHGCRYRQQENLKQSSSSKNQNEKNENNFKILNKHK